MTQLAFKEFEANVDKLINSLQLFKQPMRVNLTGLFATLNALFCEESLVDGHSPRPDAGMDLISRASYLVPLLCKCPAKPEGSSAFEAFSVFISEAATELQLLLQYAHFCEVAPYVHRGYYRISGDPENLHLSHFSDEHVRVEVADIVLCNISSPISINPTIDLTHLFEKFVLAPPKLDMRAHLFVHSAYFNWFEQYSFENEILSNEAMQACAGVSLIEFRKFRSAWLAIAEFNIQMVKAITRKLRGDSNNQDMLEEQLEWIAPLLNANFLGGVVIGLSGIKASQFDSLMKIYSFSQTRFKHCGEGFFPPIIETDIGYLFSPYILKVMLSSRNVLYSTLKIDRKKFDNVVSSLLEPQLLKEATIIFNKFSNLQIVCNSRWDLGEFDLLAYSEEENAVLHVQAKSAIPPEGARMVSRAEDRVKEAIEQLRRFAELGSESRDKILSSTFGKIFSGVQVINCVLGWANFGSENTWGNLKNNSIIPINITLLRLLSSRTKKLKLITLNRTIKELIDELVTKVDARWETSSLNLGDRTLTLPLLKVEFSNLDCHRFEVENSVSNEQQPN